jgi:RNA polymerase sigma factor (TIGR02999 family)
VTDAKKDTAMTPAGRTGPEEAMARLAPLVYEKLRATARRYMHRERSDHTLQPTALVHEAYLRLAEMDQIDWQGKTHVFAMAATQMRRILVDHARTACAKKRGAGVRSITLTDEAVPTPSRVVQILALDEALDGLARRSARQARIAELRLFSGMLIREIADVLGVSLRTAKDDWRMARAWLARELRSGGAP